jgi:hypothetical protein
MTWVKLDDQFPINRKVGALPDAAFRLHVEAICWCARNRTNGVVSREDLPQVTRIGKPARLVAMLVQRGLWHEPNHSCPSTGCAQGGKNEWVIHDYLAYNPSKDQVERERSQNAERQRRWREQRKPEDNASSNGVTDTVTNAAPSRPVPSPTGGLSSSSTHDRARAGTEPPSKCPDHEHLADPPPCGRCAGLRRARDEADVARRARIAAAPQCRRHRGQPADNCAPCRSEALAPPTGAFPVIVRSSSAA